MAGGEIDATTLMNEIGIIKTYWQAQQPNVTIENEKFATAFVTFCDQLIAAIEASI